MFDRYLIVAAYYIIASRYHSGQASTGYRKLSQCARMGLHLAHSAETDKGSDERNEAAALLWKRRREIARHW